MDWLVLAVLAAAVLSAFMRGVGVGGRIDLGWIAVSLIIFAVWFLPLLWRLQGLT